jgi:fructose-1,6-bisphosphatase/inositol monophosphatase family enzyme
VAGRDRAGALHHQVAPHARNIGSSALAQAWVACGRLHAHARVSAGDFDIVGGNLMIAEAGGVVTDLRGGPFVDTRGGLLTAAPHVHRLLMDLKVANCLDVPLEDK